MKWLFVLLALLWGGVSASADVAPQWNEFLLNPGDQTLSILTNGTAADAGECREDLAPNQKQRRQLLALIEKGNQWGFRAALLVSPCWDGSDAEDFYRASGIFFERLPCTFLRILEERRTSDTQLRLMLTMLPLSTVDDFDEKLAMIRKRISILRGINDAALSDLKGKALVFLINEETKFMKIRSQT
jgi:hypothetical protein